jgi:hypothetical protein
MDCPLKAGRLSIEATEIFVAYSARTLSPAEESEFTLHLKSCSACLRIAEAQQEVWSALDAWTPAPVASNFDALLYARINAEQRTPWWQRVPKVGLEAIRDWRMNWSWKPAMPVAAACAALLAAFLLKSPAIEHQAEATLQPRVDIEQVERALDDIDMLQKIGVASSAPVQPVQPQTL